MTDAPMKSAVETLGPTRVKLTVEVPFDELKPSLDAAYRKIGQQVRVKRFRPGKVPPRILDQSAGRAAAPEQAVHDSWPRRRGLSAGESKEFATQLRSGEHGGDTAQATVTVRTVKEKDVPALDDDFAQTASEFDTLDELRADIRSRLERVGKLQQGVQARDRVLEVLLDTVDV